MHAPAVRGRWGPLDKPLRCEVVQNPAQIPKVKIEHGPDLPRSGEVSDAQLEEDARLSEREARVEESLTQNSNASRVEAIERSEGIDFDRFWPTLGGS